MTSQNVYPIILSNMIFMTSFSFVIVGQIRLLKLIPKISMKYSLNFNNLEKGKSAKFVEVKHGSKFYGKYQ